MEEEFKSNVEYIVDTYNNEKTNPDIKKYILTNIISAKGDYNYIECIIVAFQYIKFVCYYKHNELFTDYGVYSVLMPYSELADYVKFLKRIKRIKTIATIINKNKIAKK